MKTIASHWRPKFTMYSFLLLMILSVSHSMAEDSSPPLAPKPRCSLSIGRLLVGASNIARAPFRTRPRILVTLTSLALIVGPSIPTSEGWRSPFLSGLTSLRDGMARTGNNQTQIQSLWSQPEALSAVPVLRAPTSESEVLKARALGIGAKPGAQGVIIRLPEDSNLDFRHNDFLWGP